jgi:hypothetical protein
VSTAHSDIPPAHICPTTGPIATKLWWNGPWMAPFQNVSGDPDFQPRWPPRSNGHLKKFLFLVTAVILNGGRGCRTQIWKEFMHCVNTPSHSQIVLLFQFTFSGHLIIRWRSKRYKHVHGEMKIFFMKHTSCSFNIFFSLQVKCQILTCIDSLKITYSPKIRLLPAWEKC